MQFESYKYIWFFWVLVALAVAFVLFEYRRRRLLHVLCPKDQLRKRLPTYWWMATSVRFVFFILALALMGVALMKPYSDFEMREVKRRGVDLYFLVDLSQSMDAQDISPSRLTRARREIADFVSKLTGDRVGLIGFAGDSFVFVPLTTDYKTFSLFAEELNSDSIPIQGTDIKGALEKAVTSFQKFSSSASKAIILITDGEDSVGLSDDVLAAIKKLDIKVFVMGIGTLEGGPIPVDGGGYKNDTSGQVVISKLNEEALKQIAVVTSGAYVRSVTGDLDLDQIYFGGIKKSFADADLLSEQKRLPLYQFQPLLLASVLLIFLELLTTNKRRYWLGKLYKGWRVTLPVVFIFLFVTEAQAYNPFKLDNAVKGYQSKDYAGSQKTLEQLLVQNPDDPQLNFNAANNFYRLGQFKEAEAAYTKALNSPNQNIRKQSLYNIGNSLYRQKNLEASLDYYNQALKMESGFTEAKLNYDFVKKQLEQQKNQQDKKDEKKDQDKQDEQKSDTKTGSNTATSTDTGSSQQSETETDTGTSTSTSTSTSTNTDTNTNTGSGTSSSTDTGSGQQSDTSTGTETSSAASATETNTGTGTGSAQQIFLKDAQAEQWLDSIEDNPGAVVKQMILKQNEGKKRQKIEKDW